MLDSFFLAMDSVLACGLVILGVLALLRGGSHKLNRHFFALSLFLALWIISNYFSNNFALALPLALLANRLIFTFGLLGILFITSFVVIICQPPIAWLLKILQVIAWLFALCSLTPLITESITRQDQVYAVNFGILAYPYFILMLVLIGYTSYSLIYGLIVKKGLDKKRIKLIAFSILAAVLVAVILNVVAPILGIFTLTNFGPLAMVMLVVGLSYGVVRYKLFDIRLIIARSFAYILIVLSLAIAYGISLSFIAAIVTGSRNDLNDPKGIIAVIVAVALAFTFQPLRRFFDKVSNKLFYEDVYDPQVLLSQFNKSLVGETDIRTLLKGSLSIILNSISVTGGIVELAPTAYSQKRLIGDDSFLISKNALTPAAQTLSKLHTQSLVTDNLNDQYSQLQQQLQTEGIAAIYNLSSTAKNQPRKHLGYLVFGPKKSGRSFTSQDQQVMQIIANELTLAVQNLLHFEEIQNFNETLKEKVASATTELRRSNKKLRALDEAKDEFISIASHQLRTPLTTVKGQLSMVLDGDTGKLSAAQQQLLRDTYESADRMAFLITDLLNVSRLKDGRLTVVLAPASLPRIVEEQIDQLSAHIKSHELTITTDIAPDLPTIKFDVGKIRQVIMNFIDNAVFYSKHGGTIVISVKQVGEFLQLTVRDDGIGVPASEQTQIFTKFFRASNARYVRPDGTGIGLFSASKIIEAHHGTMIFESKENKGSTFGFRLPIEQPDIVPNKKDA